MLPKSNRLKKKKDFERVFENGKTAKEGFLILKTAKNDLDVSRFAFVVSKKISAKAVVRNKVRRRLVAAVEKDFKGVKEGFDAVFIALPGLDKKNFSEIKEKTGKLLNKLKLNNVF